MKVVTIGTNYQQVHVETYMKRHTQRAIGGWDQGRRLLHAMRTVFFTARRDDDEDDDKDGGTNPRLKLR